MKKLLILLLVFGLASAASAALPVTDDFESPMTLGALNGQGNWSASSSFEVVSETGNQYCENAYAGTKTANRTLAFSDDVYRLDLDFRLGSRQDTWGTGTPCQLQVRESDGADPIHLKWEPSERFRVGDVWLVDYGNIADGIITDLANPYTDWVSVAVVCNETAGEISAYWEGTDGSMQYVGDGQVQGGTAGVDQANIKYSTRSGGEGSEFDIDNISITPEPATIMMLGLGGLALIRRKR